MTNKQQLSLLYNCLKAIISGELLYNIKTKTLKIFKCYLLEHYRPILKDIKKSLEGHIVLDCDADLISTVFKQAKEVNLLDDYHSFIITSLVRTNPICFNSAISFIKIIGSVFGCRMHIR